MVRRARKSKRRDLLADPDVERWYKNCSRGSHVTAEVNLRRLGLFCEQHDLTPKQLVALGRDDRGKLEDLLQDHVTWMEDEGYAPGYVEGVLKGVRSWLVHNEVELKRKIKISNSGATPTLEDERVPEKRELKTILMYGDERVSAAVCLVAQAGLRLQVLGNALGDDGLTIGDLPELKVHEDHVEVTRIPAMIIVRPSLSKAKHKYLTFLPIEGCEYVTAYLTKRLAQGETFTAKTPVIATKTDHTFNTTRNISKIIRKTMRPRYTWRPYVLRAYCDTQLLLAESHGRISHPYRMFFMGHKGDIEARYTTNKGRLPENLIEDMRRSFRDCEEYLSTRPSSREEDSELTTIRTMVESGVLDLSKPNVRQYLVKKLGIEDVEVKVAKMKGKGLNEDDAYARIICGELGVEPIKVEVLKPKNDSDPKRIVAEEELEHYLAEGWDVQTVLPSGKILVRKEV